MIRMLLRGAGNDADDSAELDTIVELSPILTENRRQFSPRPQSTRGLGIRSGEKTRSRVLGGILLRMEFSQKFLNKGLNMKIFSLIYVQPSMHVQGQPRTIGIRIRGMDVRST